MSPPFIYIQRSCPEHGAACAPQHTCIGHSTPSGADRETFADGFAELSAAVFCSFGVRRIRICAKHLYKDSEKTFGEEKLE